MFTHVGIVKSLILREIDLPLVGSLECIKRTVNNFFTLIGQKREWQKVRTYSEALLLLLDDVVQEPLVRDSRALDLLQRPLQAELKILEKTRSCLSIET